MEITKRKLVTIVGTSIVVALLAGIFLGTMVLASPGPGIVIYPDYIDMATLTSDPTLSEGRFWFRSDLDKLRYAVSGSASKEIWTDAKDMYDYKGVFWVTYFEDFQGFSRSLSGTGSVEMQGSYLHLQTGTTQNSYATCYAPKSSLFGSFTWNKNRRFKTLIQPIATSNQTIWIISGSKSSDQHIGFKIVNSTLYGTVADGSSESTLSILTVELTWYKLECVFLTGSEARFYVYDVDKGALSTNLPTGTNYENLQMYLRISNDWEASNKRIWIQSFAFLQEP